MDNYKLQSLDKDGQVLWEKVVEAFEERRIEYDPVTGRGRLVVTTETGNELTPVTKNKSHDHFVWEKV